MRVRARRGDRRAAGDRPARRRRSARRCSIGDRAGLDSRADRAAPTRRDVPRDRHLGRQHRAAQRPAPLWTLGLDLSAPAASPWRLTAAVLVAYAFVVGGGASVLRATGMAVVGLAGAHPRPEGVGAQRPGAHRRGAARRRSAARRRHRLLADHGGHRRARRRARRRRTCAAAGGAAGRALVLTSVWAETGPAADCRRWPSSR